MSEGIIWILENARLEWMEGDIFKMCQREHGNFRDHGQKKSRKAKEEKNISKSQRAKSLCVIPLQKPVMTRRLDKDRNPPCAADMHMSDHVQQ